MTFLNINDITAAGGGISLLSVSRGLLGIVALVIIAFLFSTNKRKINWKLVGIGLGVQLLLAVCVLYVPFIQTFFEIIGKIFVNILEFTKSGTAFVFGDYLMGMNPDSPKVLAYTFALHALPTIVFFSALTSLLYYLNIIQWVVFGIAWCLKKVLNISGAEGLTVAGNIFLGQTESPLLIKKYLPNMNRSEIFLVMTGGMATIAGSVLGAFIGMLGGDDPVAQLEFAKHLLSASVMAAPGAIVMAKIIFPQTEHIDSEMKIEKSSVGSNWLDALSNGTTDGIKLAVNVAGQLIVFIALIAFVNYVFSLVGRIGGFNEWIADITNGRYETFSLECIMGLIFTPITWLMGVNSQDIMLAGNLLGQKIVVNEFMGFTTLSQLKLAGAFADPKTIILATYFLCGFANISSIGIQVGGIGSLAPTKRTWLTEMGMKAVIAGTLVSCVSATMVGMILG